jgi:hypothetical protein
VVAGATPIAPAGGHLSRFPGDTSHLKSFTQTAQVPAVGSRPTTTALPPGLRFDSTDSIPVTRRPLAYSGPAAPLALRVAVWSSVLLLVLGVAAIAVHHFRPAWLVDVHLVGASPSGASGHPTTGAKAGTPSEPFVIDTATGATSATLTVRSPVYDIVVTTQAPCWIHVTSPAGPAPLFSATVPAGTTKSFRSTDGQLTVELGASRAVVTAQVLGKTLPGFSLTPSAAPYVMTFRSSVS